MSNEPDGNRNRGFTLAELLVSAAVGALVLGGLAESLELFGEHVEQVRAGSDDGPDAAVALMADYARRGWLVEQPEENELCVSGADGAVTHFALDDGALVVTRPSGKQGVLLQGVAELGIETETVRRLREASPVHDYRGWWQRELPSELLTGIELESGMPFALGFTMASDVPDEYDVVDDVEEHALSATLDTIVLPLAWVPVIPPDPNEPVAGDSEGGKKGGSKKVTICHVPPGNPENAHTLVVSENAVDAHLAHGDSLGACSADPPDDWDATLFVSLYEARAPDDARPFGEALGTMSIPAWALPIGSAEWVATTVVSDPGSGDGQVVTPEGKVVLCHVPPGNPKNAHTICVAPQAVPAHLAHGDYYGVCGEHDDSTSAWVLDVDLPPLQALDLSPLNALVVPGRAYTLVFELEGSGFVASAGAPLASPTHSGVAQAGVLDGALEAVSIAVPFELEGLQEITQTAEHHPVSRVSLALEMDDGRNARASSSVFSQVAVPDAWSGAVHGEHGDVP